MGKKLLTQLCCPPLVRSKPYIYMEIIHYITEDYIFRYASRRKKGSSHTFLVNGKNKVTVYILWSLHWVEPWFSLPRGPGALKSKPRVFHGYDISLKKKNQSGFSSTGNRVLWNVETITRLQPTKLLWFFLPKNLPRSFIWKWI